MMETGLHQYQSIFSRAQNTTRRTLDRQSLPTPFQYLTERGLLKNKVRGEWASICCPVHKGGAENNPSLRVSQVDGHFSCMACGVKGGDIIALHRLITGKGFIDAVRDLGGRFHD
jgi:hypothetical protein